MGYSKSQLAEEGCLRIGSLPVAKKGSYTGLLCRDTEILSKKKEKKMRMLQGLGLYLMS